MAPPGREQTDNSARTTAVVAGGSGNVETLVFTMIKRRRCRANNDNNNKYTAAVAAAHLCQNNERVRGSLPPKNIHVMKKAALASSKLNGNPPTSRPRDHHRHQHHPHLVLLILLNMQFSSLSKENASRAATDILDTVRVPCICALVYPSM